MGNIKRLKNDTIGIEALEHKGKILTDSREKAEALADQYQSVFTVENLEEIPQILPSPYPDMESFTVTEKGVLSQLEDLNVHKSVGPDGLSPHLLKLLAPIIAPALTRIFKQSLSLGKSPAD